MAHVGRSTWDLVEEGHAEITVLFATGLPLEEAMRRTVAALRIEAEGAARWG